MVCLTSVFTSQGQQATDLREGPPACTERLARTGGLMAAHRPEDKLLAANLANRRP